MPDKTAKIYWACASMYQIGNYKPEIKLQNGDIAQREEPIRFYDHIIATDDPKVQKFIEASNGFACGDIKLCQNMREAELWTAQKKRMKTALNTGTAEDISSTRITEKGIELPADYKPVQGEVNAG